MLIEDYAMIGNRATAALVGRSGSIDWLCLPRFDSDACFAALLGDRENGRWLIGPREAVTRLSRRYRMDTMILETDMQTETGTIRLTDCMITPPSDRTHLVRTVTCLSGQVEVHLDLVLRLGFGRIVPWVRRIDGGHDLVAIAGPDMIVLRSEVPLTSANFHTEGDFLVTRGQTIRFALQWLPSHLPLPDLIDIDRAVLGTERHWREWIGQMRLTTRWPDAVARSLMTLHALTHWQTGGIVAAPTSSLPESIGGERNWDYRYCWLRDASLTLQALLRVGYIEEASAWQDWLDRAVAGSPEDVQIMYGIAGERRLVEWEVPWLAGYEGSRPVRVGNSAAGQVQLDVYGEMADALVAGHRAGMPRDSNSWQIRLTMLKHLEKIWTEPDDGIWEMRGGRRHFVHSKVMAWVAFDRSIRAIEEFGYEGPLEHWRSIREAMHAEICEKGVDPEERHFVQCYGSTEVDASLLLIPIVGFLPPDDPRVVNTIAAIEQELLVDGFVRRYKTDGGNDGLAGSEGVFLACSFWLVDNYVLMGRLDDAETLFRKLIALQNDLGLLSEEYDVDRKRLIGNFPQAFTHIALVNSALSLSAAIQEFDKLNGLEKGPNA